MLVLVSPPNGYEGRAYQVIQLLVPEIAVNDSSR
jgi:hypothetical protein